jgi:hypothetical protein
MCSCLSRADQPSAPSAPRVYAKQHNALGLAVRSDSPFAVVPSLVRPLERRAVENPLRQFEIDAVLRQVGGAFAFIPFERHNCIYVL